MWRDAAYSLPRLSSRAADAITTPSRGTPPSRPDATDYVTDVARNAAIDATAADTNTDAATDAGVGWDGVATATQNQSIGRRVDQPIVSATSERTITHVNQRLKSEAHQARLVRSPK